MIRWNIGRPNGWRIWDLEIDAKSEDLKRADGADGYEALRGSFVDTDKRIAVPIRGALDFTRKGFLSCS